MKNSQAVTAAAVFAALSLAGSASTAWAQVMPKDAAPTLESLGHTWTKQPSRGRIERGTPDRALRMEMEGWAVMECRFRADGKVENCRVLAEAPLGYQFGEAAVALARYFEFQHPNVDLAGTKVSIPIRFRM